MDLSIFISKPPILFLYFEFIFFFRLYSGCCSGRSDPLGMKTLILSVAGVLLMLTAESLLGNFPGPQWAISSKVTPHSQGQSVSTDWLVLGYKGLAPQFDSGHLWRTLPSNPLSTLQGTGRAFAAVHHNSASPWPCFSYFSRMLLLRILPANLLHINICPWDHFPGNLT